MEVLPPFDFKCDGKLLAYLEGSMTGGSGPGWQHCARKSTGFGIREVCSKFPYTTVNWLHHQEGLMHHWSMTDEGSFHFLPFPSA